MRAPAASATNHPIAISRTPEWFELLETIRVPVLVAYGTDDKIFPPGHGSAIANEIPGAKLVELKGVGHTFKISGMPDTLRTRVWSRRWPASARRSSPSPCRKLRQSRCCISWPPG